MSKVAARIGHMTTAEMVESAARAAGRVLRDDLRGITTLANPIVAVIAAIGAGAYLIYANWDGIVAYFTAKIDLVRGAFDKGLLNGVLKILSEFNPFRLMTDAALSLVEQLTGWDLSPVREMLHSVFDFNPFRLMTDAAEALFTYLTGWSFADVTAAVKGAFDIDLYDAGVAMILSLWNGIKAKIGEMAAWVKSQLTSMVPAWMLNAFTSEGAGDAANMGGAMDETAAFASPEGWRELGGPVRAGRTVMVGERGIELFTPSRDGWIVPNRRLTSARGGSGLALNLGGVTINAAPGMDPGQIARAVRREVEAMARSARNSLHDGADYAV